MKTKKNLPPQKHEIQNFDHLENAEMNDIFYLQEEVSEKHNITQNKDSIFLKVFVRQMKRSAFFLLVSDFCFLFFCVTDLMTNLNRLRR
jgi:hypothetical protein